jgi:hypothetical protein
LGLVARRRAIRFPEIRRKTMATWGVILGIASFGLGCVGYGIVYNAVDDLDKSLNETSQQLDDYSEPAAAKPAAEKAPTFENGVLTTLDMKIQITGYKAIEAGQKDNEYGDKPVIAFWYTTTNLSDDDVTPTDFILYFNAIQDNDSNAVNELEVGSLPDDRFLDSQMETIKKGGTVENAVAYELDDLVTPVELVATEGLDEVIGKATYTLK